MWNSNNWRTKNESILAERVTFSDINLKKFSLVAEWKESTKPVNTNHHLSDEETDGVRRYYSLQATQPLHG